MNKKNLSIGTWVTIPNEAIAEIFAQSGFEWIVIDLEHSAININQAEKLIRVIDLAKTGDAEKRMVLSEYGLKVKNEAALGVCADLTTS